MRAVSRLLAPLVLLALAVTTSIAQPKLTADDLPQFQVRAKVAAVGGKVPEAKAEPAGVRGGSRVVARVARDRCPE